MLVLSCKILIKTAIGDTKSAIYDHLHDSSYSFFIYSFSLSLFW